MQRLTSFLVKSQLCILCPSGVQRLLLGWPPPPTTNYKISQRCVSFCFTCLLTALIKFKGWKSETIYVCMYGKIARQHYSSLARTAWRWAATSLIWWSDDFFYAAVFLMKMQLSDLGNRWFGENFITLPLTTTWVEHNIHNCCQNQLVAARYREHIRSSNWNGLQSGRDGGIHSEQISSILLAVCKQLLINNIVTVWRQMTQRLQKNTHTRCLGVGKLPGASAHPLTHSQIWL